MNHDILKEIIFDQHEIIRKFKIVEREYSFDIKADYVLVGLRRAGKSTMLYKIVQDLVATGVDWNQIIYINFEDERLSDFKTSDFNDIIAVQSELSDKEGWFFLDELQNIDGWERFARRMADAKHHVFITGSNAKMLSSEIEKKLGGRYLTQYITPYNFREFLTAHNVDFSSASISSTRGKGIIRRLFSDYFYYGGFPESIGLTDKRGYVASIYQKVLLGDIAGRHGIRNISGLRIMMKKIAEAVKDPLSYSKIHNILKTIGIDISKDTVIDYMRYAQESYLIFAIRNYFSKFIDRETIPKYYYNDNGLLNLFLTDEDSRLLENIVAIKLHNQYEDFYYLKSSDTDIDFFIPETGTAIQVAYSLKGTAYEREIKAIKNGFKSVKEMKKAAIITYEEEKTIDLDGVSINVIPVWKWLLTRPYK